MYGEACLFKTCHMDKIRSGFIVDHFILSLLDSRAQRDTYSYVVEVVGKCDILMVPT